EPVALSSGRGGCGAGLCGPASGVLSGSSPDGSGRAGSGAADRVPGSGRPVSGAVSGAVSGPVSGAVERVPGSGTVMKEPDGPGSAGSELDAASGVSPTPEGTAGGAAISLGGAATAAASSTGDGRLISATTATAAA